MKMAAIRYADPRHVIGCIMYLHFEKSLCQLNVSIFKFTSNLLPENFSMNDNRFFSFTMEKLFSLSR